MTRSYRCSLLLGLGLGYATVGNALLYKDPKPQETNDAVPMVEMTFPIAGDMSGSFLQEADDLHAKALEGAVDTFGVEIRTSFACAEELATGVYEAAGQEAIIKDRNVYPPVKKAYMFRIRPWTEEVECYSVEKGRYQCKGSFPGKQMYPSILMSTMCTTIANARENEKEPRGRNTNTFLEEEPDFILRATVNHDDSDSDGKVAAQQISHIADKDPKAKTLVLLSEGAADDEVKAKTDKIQKLLEMDASRRFKVTRENPEHNDWWDAQFGRTMNPDEMKKAK